MTAKMEKIVNIKIEWRPGEFGALKRPFGHIEAIMSHYTLLQSVSFVKTFK